MAKKCEGKSLVRRFLDNRQGNIVMTVALLMPVLFLAAGAATDYTRMSNIKSTIDNALDAAILYVGNEVSNGAPMDQSLKAKFIESFEANYLGRYGSIPDYKIASFTVDKNTGKISATIDAAVEPAIVHLAGFDQLDVSSSGTAIFKQTDTEVAMMLDVTGSMWGAKIAALKTAASSAVDILLSDDNKDTTRIALVPYSNAVKLKKSLGKKATRGNVYVAGNGATVPGPVSQDGCVTERIGANAHTDVSYKVSRVSADPRAQGCTSPKVVALTDKRGKLKSEIQKLNAVGGTAGHIGITWSYYALSGNWADFWPGTSSDPAPYSKDVKKIAILMTDGSFNMAYAGTAGTNTYPYDIGGPITAESNNSAKNLCADMKAKKGGAPGLTIYSVAFSAPADAQALLKECATPDTATQTYYYSADSAAELKAAFEDIAQSIKSLRLSE